MSFCRESLRYFGCVTKLCPGAERDRFFRGAVALRSRLGFTDTPVKVVLEIFVRGGKKAVGTARSRVYVRPVKRL